ncbi:hypothetical protein EN35_32675 [Rhodococcus qingshengii]|nr:hypothetical protein EN35_32675 [Rhodococcus qingshengii]
MHDAAVDPFGFNRGQRAQPSPEHSPAEIAAAAANIVSLIPIVGTGAESAELPCKKRWRLFCGAAEPPQTPKPQVAGQPPPPVRPGIEPLAIRLFPSETDRPRRLWVGAEIAK